jgi:hypothetical protein
MALTYTQIWGICKNNEYLCKVEVASVKAAIQISAEADTVTNHTNRLLLAHAVLMSPEQYSKLFINGIANDSTVQTSPTDANILAAVLSNWDAYAGVAV